MNTLKSEQPLNNGQTVRSLPIHMLSLHFYLGRRDNLSTIDKQFAPCLYVTTFLPLKKGQSLYNRQTVRSLPLRHYISTSEEGTISLQSTNSSLPASTSLHLYLGRRDNLSTMDKQFAPCLYVTTFLPRKKGQPLYNGQTVRSLPLRHYISTSEEGTTSLQSTNSSLPASTSLHFYLGRRDNLSTMDKQFAPCLYVTTFLPRKKGQPLYNGQTVRSLPLRHYISTSEEGTTSLQWTNSSLPAYTYFIDRIIIQEDIHQSLLATPI